MGAGGLLLALLGSLAVLVVGVWQWQRGVAQQAQAAAQAGTAQDDPALDRVHGAVTARLRASRPGRALERRLVTAGVDLDAGSALAIVVVGPPVVYLASVWLLPVALALVLAAGVVVGADLYLRHRRDQRLERFAAQLPDVARTLSNASSAGLALPSALSLASSDLDDPARSELGQVVAELQLGQSLDRAMANLERRMPSREVGVLVSTLVIQQRAGGDVVEALRDMAATLDQRKETLREVKSQLAGAKSGGYAVPIIALGSVLMVDQLEPGALDNLIATWPGRAVLSVGLGLFAAAFLLIRRLTRIEV